MPSFKNIRDTLSLLRTSVQHRNPSSPAVCTTQDKRWSEVVPPETALGFVALYDPEEGLVTFSAAELVDHSPATPRPSFPSDGRGGESSEDGGSQVLTIRDVPRDRAPSGGAAMLSCLRGAFCESKTPIYERYHRQHQQHQQRHPPEPFSAARASSDVEGTEGPRSVFGAPGEPRRAPSVVTDEGYAEGRHRPESLMTDDGAVLVELNLSSAFSVSTGSTSNFIYVEDDIDEYGAGDDGSLCSWAEVEAPGDMPAHALPPTRRRLRKRRPAHPAKPAPAEQVLARTVYGHETAPPLPPPPPPLSVDERGSLRRMADRIGGRKPGSDQKWVCVDVKQVVTQRLVD